MISKAILKYGNFGNKDENRNAISFLTSLLGLVINILLSFLKLTIGFFTGAISIFADAINNILDCLSAIITILGMKFSNKYPDKIHPYGYGRVEYIESLFISILVIFTGIEFISRSYERIVNPKPLLIDNFLLIVLLISILLKLMLTIIYKNVGKAINSKPLLATSFDSLGDILVTGTVVFGLIIDKVFGLTIDGYIGILVSIFILYSGFSLVKDTLSSIIGEVPSKEFFDELITRLYSYPYIQNVHDVIITNYGPQKTIVVLDVQVPYTLDLVTAHEIVYQAEKEISQSMKIHLVIHVDAVGNYTKEELEMKDIILKLFENYPSLKSFHDFKIYDDTMEIDFITDGNIIDSKSSEEHLRTEIISFFTKYKPNYKYLITLDRLFYAS